MKKLIIALIGSLASATVATQPTASPLIVVEDKGGSSALPWYQALNPEQQDAPATTQPPARLGTASEAETAMLPVRSAQLSPGEEPRRVIRAPGLPPLFLIGDDAQSRKWLAQNRSRLSELDAIGLVVNVAGADEMAALRRIAPELTLSPTPADDLARRLGVGHYPVLITATGIEP